MRRRRHANGVGEPRARLADPDFAVDLLERSEPFELEDRARSERLGPLELTIGESGGDRLLDFTLGGHTEVLEEFPDVEVKAIFDHMSLHSAGIGCRNIAPNGRVGTVLPRTDRTTSTRRCGYFEGGHTCGLTSAGEAFCWGDNDVGAIGDGTTGGRRMPVAVAGGHRFASISAGLRHTCGRRMDGTVYCWGSGRTGQLGTNSTYSSALAMKVVGQP